MRRRTAIGWILSVMLVAAQPGLHGAPPPLPEMPSRGKTVALSDDPQRQFDFWLGRWSVQNKHLQDDGTWRYSGTAVALIQPVADGSAVLEQWNGTLDGNPLIGFSLRAWDPELDAWVLYLNWHGGSPGGFSEMRGERNGERIEQFPPGDRTKLRYSFSRVHEDSCQWEEARSEDGEHWMTRWIMQFTRREAPLPVDAANAPIVRPPEKTAAFPETRALDFLVGAWHGPAKALGSGGAQEAGAVRARVTSMIEGFGLLQFVDTSWGEKTLTALGHDRRAQGWVGLRAESGSGGLSRMTGTLAEDGTVRFDGETMREGWSCSGPDRCTLSRETSPDGGDSWQTVLSAELTRSASTAAWIDLPKARAPRPDILTGGLPTAEQLETAARLGYRTVINLIPPSEEGQLVAEERIVRELGLRYVLIPVASADDINVDNAKLLAQALEGEDVLPAIVHCRSSNRVGALFALKTHELDGVPAEQALEAGREAGLTRLEPVVRERLGLPAAQEE